MLAAPGSSRASRRVESSSLSEYTKVVNTEMTRTIHKLREIEHARTHAGHDENMMRVDAQKLLRATDRELKCISYKLSTVISDGEYHRMLQQRMENEIEAIESTPIYCKLFCRGELGPARFRVTYRSRGDLRVLVSTAHKMPNEAESQKGYNNPDKFVVHSAGRERRFGCEFVYLTFFSSLGCSINVHCDF